MKATTSKRAATQQDEMQAEYDLKHMQGGVRGKYDKAYRAGYSVQIRKPDGRIVVKTYKPIDGSIVIAPALRKYFTDSESVNEVLR